MFVCSSLLGLLQSISLFQQGLSCFPTFSRFLHLLAADLLKSSSLEDEICITMAFFIVGKCETIILSPLVSMALIISCSIFGGNQPIQGRFLTTVCHLVRLVPWWSTFDPSPADQIVRLAVPQWPRTAHIDIQTYHITKSGVALRWVEYFGRFDTTDTS